MVALGYRIQRDENDWDEIIVLNFAVFQYRIMFRWRVFFFITSMLLKTFRFINSLFRRVLIKFDTRIQMNNN